MARARAEGETEKTPGRRRRMRRVVESWLGCLAAQPQIACFFFFFSLAIFVSRYSSILILPVVLES